MFRVYPTKDKTFTINLDCRSFLSAFAAPPAPPAYGGNDANGSTGNGNGSGSGNGNGYAGGYAYAPAPGHAEAEADFMDVGADADADAAGDVWM